MASGDVKINLDKVLGPPYATPSMRSASSPDMWARRSFAVQSWTERGDLENGREEEGEEGSEEEEVGAFG
jgi:hypothetical protein